MLRPLSAAGHDAGRFIRPDLFDGIHDQLGGHIGKDPVKLVFILEAFFLITGQEFLAARQLFKRSSFPETHAALGDFRPGGFDKVLI